MGLDESEELLPCAVQDELARGSYASSVMRDCLVLNQLWLLHLVMESFIPTWSPLTIHEKEEEVPVATSIFLMAEARTERVASHVPMQKNALQMSIMLHH